jgi:hypothetical protein
MSNFKVTDKYVENMLEKSTLKFCNMSGLLNVDCTLPNGYVISVVSTERTQEKREEGCMKLIRKTIKELESYVWYCEIKKQE